MKTKNIPDNNGRLYNALIRAGLKEKIQILSNEKDPQIGHYVAVYDSTQDFHERYHGLDSLGKWAPRFEAVNRVADFIQKEVRKHDFPRTTKKNFQIIEDFISEYS